MGSGTRRCWETQMRAAHEKPYAEQRADETTVERHPAMPNGDDFDWVLKIVGELVAAAVDWR